MAEGSPRKVFGRLLTVVGFVWLFWAVVGGMIASELGRNLLTLPILPGIVLLFIGRAFSRSSRRRQREQEVETPDETPATRQAPESIRPPSIRPAPSPTRTVASRRIESAPEPEADAIAEALGDMQQEIADAVVSIDSRKTSAEMVAEARERFGKRP